MSTRGGPGQGTTLGLSVDTTIARIRSLQLPSWATQPVDFTGLSDLDWFAFLAADLQDGGTVVAEMYFDTELALPTLRTIQVATLTLPIQTPGNTTPATIVGSYGRGCHA